MEKYQPGPEELEAAKQHLTPMQMDATSNRESVFNANETVTGVSGALMKRKESGELKEGAFQQIFEGEINGHKVELKKEGRRWRANPNERGYQVTYDKISAVVDGIEMSSEEARKINQKFAGQTMSEGQTDEDIGRIENERRAFQLQEIRKDLGI